MNYTIRPAIATDLQTLNHIAVASKAHWGYPAAWMERWRDDLSVTEKDLTEQLVVLLEVDGLTAGFCAILERPDCYEIMHLWLLPAYIGRGFGKVLLSRAIERAATRPKPIRVESDPNAEPFYRSQGFDTIGQVESYPPGRFLPVLERPASR